MSVPSLSHVIAARLIATVLLTGAPVGAATPAFAGAPTEQLKTSVEQIVRVLEDPAMRPEARAKERRAAIRKEALGVFDFGETARRTLQCPLDVFVWRRAPIRNFSITSRRGSTGSCGLPTTRTLLQVSVSSHGGLWRPSSLCVAKRPLQCFGEIFL